MTNPWITIPRSSWAKLSRVTQFKLDDATLERLRGVKDPTSQADVEEVYLPLVQLINYRRASHDDLGRMTSEFLRIPDEDIPFVIGIAGSVAVGKSTVARLLQELLRRSPGSPRVELVTTDGFLYPNAILSERGILDRKGFPESYDRRALLEFMVQVKSGQSEVTTPKYSHVIYDIVASEHETIRNPDIVIVEGLNVLQPPLLNSPDSTGLAVSDFFDFSIYVDAKTSDIRDWFVNRFFALRDSAFKDPNSFFRSYAEMPEDQAHREALDVWHEINERNLVENILPTKGRASLILAKDASHRIDAVKMRKI